MKLSIITPERTLIKDESVLRVTLPTRDGEITVLPGHTPVIAILSAGEIIIGNVKGVRSLAASGGFVEITKTDIRILADSGEFIHELDMKLAEEAKKRAEGLLKNKDKNDVDFSAISAKLGKELARIKVGKKYRDVGKPHPKQ